MSPDPNKKMLRQFQCRESLWQRFEQMAKELECSVDYLINDAMKQYARQRGYTGNAAASQRSDTNAPPPSSVGASAPQTSASTTSHAVTHAPLASPAQVSPIQQTPGSGAHAVPPTTRHGSGAHPMPTQHTPAPVAPPPVATSATAPSSRFGAPPALPTTGGLPPALPGSRIPAHVPPPAPPAPGAKRVGPPPMPMPAAAPAPLAPPAIPPGASRAPAPPPPLPQGHHPRTLSSAQMPVANAVAPTPKQLQIRYQGQNFVVNKEKFIIGRGKQSSDLTIKIGRAHV